MKPSLDEENKLWKKGYKRVACLDESGRGPLAGPVVAAAVIINQKSKIKNQKYKLKIKNLNNLTIEQLSNLAIRDSKKLSSLQREKLYKILTNSNLIEWGIGKVSEKVIDKINILEATKLAMERAIKRLKRKPNFLIIDGNFKINSNISQKSIIKADEKVFSCVAASVPYGVKLYLLFKNSRLVCKTIGSLYEYGNLKDYKVFSVDPADYKVKKFPITGIIKHPVKEVWTIITKSRKRVQVTPDHSLFTLKRSYLTPIKVSKLKKGDHIATGKTIPFKGKSKTEIDLIEVFKNQSTKQRPIIIEGNNIKRVIKENEDYIKTKSIEMGYSGWDIYSWKNKLYLPINLLPPYYNGKNLAGVAIRAGWSPYKFSAIFSFNKDLFWLLGFYVAEGSKYQTSSKRRKYSVLITNKDKSLQKRVARILKKINITPRLYGINMEIGGIILNRLITFLGTGDGARNKKIPDIVFTANRNHRIAFLEGYIAGDGWKDKDNLKSGTVSMKSTSKNLIKDLELLYLSLAKNISIYKKPYSGRPVLLPQGNYTTNVGDCWDIRELSYNSRNAIFGIPIKGVQGELQERIKKTNLNMQKIRDITGFDLWSSINRAKTITPSGLSKINKLLQSKKIKKLLKSDLAWDEIVEVKKDKKVQDVYDIEVRPEGRIIENFIGEGGTIYHNSIIAKVTRDRIMRRYHKKYPQYGFDKHKGYPTRLHRAMLKKYGLCEIHRRSFKPVAKMRHKFSPIA